MSPAGQSTVCADVACPSHPNHHRAGELEKKKARTQQPPAEEREQHRTQSGQQRQNTSGDYGVSIKEECFE
jgi:Na+-translocating ferredoxin:NAD+ oxidoreductase RnfC subunit